LIAMQVTANATADVLHSIEAVRSQIGTMNAVTARLPM
jgi:hypothetical protein